MTERLEKRCPRCDTVRDASAFGKVRTRPDGLSAYCKQCRRAMDGLRYSDPQKRERHLENMAQQYRRKRKHKLTQAKKYRDDLRTAALAAYGGEIPRCVCCGETHVEFLEIDHINNDGAEHRREVGSSIQVLRWLRRNNYPPGFQLLCRNCNLAKSVYGQCPHERERA